MVLGGTVGKRQVKEVFSKIKEIIVSSIITFFGGRTGVCHEDYLFSADQENSSLTD